MSPEQPTIIDLILVERILSNLQSFTKVPKSGTLSQYQWSGKEQTDDNFYKNDDTFESKFARHVSVVQRPSSVESRINLELHLNL